MMNHGDTNVAKQFITAIQKNNILQKWKVADFNFSKHMGGDFIIDIDDLANIIL